MTELLKAIQSTWDTFMPNLAFRYTFMDETYATTYEDVRRMGMLFSAFALLAIFVACLGLLALSAYTVEQRSKEVSIRKVLGGSILNIVRLLTQNFMILILIASVIATPISFFMMRKWLEYYVYRIGLSWETFALAWLIAIVITLITVCYFAIRSAITNPTRYLRTE